MKPPRGSLDQITTRQLVYVAMIMLVLGFGVSVGVDYAWHLLGGPEPTAKRAASGALFAAMLPFLLLWWFRYVKRMRGTDA